MAKKNSVTSALNGLVKQADERRKVLQKDSEKTQNEKAELVSQKQSLENEMRALEEKMREIDLANDTLTKKEQQISTELDFIKEKTEKYKSIEKYLREKPELAKQVRPIEDIRAFLQKRVSFCEKKVLSMKYFRACVKGSQSVYDYLLKKSKELSSEEFVVFLDSEISPIVDYNWTLPARTLEDFFDSSLRRFLADNYADIDKSTLAFISEHPFPSDMPTSKFSFPELHYCLDDLRGFLEEGLEDCIKRTFENEKKSRGKYRNLNFRLTGVQNRELPVRAAPRHYYYSLLGVIEDDSAYRKEDEVLEKVGIKRRTLHTLICNCSGSVEEAQSILNQMFDGIENCRWDVSVTGAGLVVDASVGKKTVFKAIAKEDIKKALKPIADKVVCEYYKQLGGKLPDDELLKSTSTKPLEELMQGRA